MKKRMILGILGLALIAGWGMATDLVPTAVSPGFAGGVALLRHSCPTFSWTAVSWALSYKIVVFEAAGKDALPYETIAAHASPVLSQEVQGGASSWTPSGAEELADGGSYVWYVGAMVDSAQGRWSEGRRFVVVEGPVWDGEKQKRVLAALREGGASEDAAGKVLQEMNAGLTGNLVADFHLTGESQGGVQGIEGASNTLYGKYAGYSLTTGTKNSFFGRSAGYPTTSGSGNTFLGYYAGRYNNTGAENTFVGREAGFSNTNGLGNTFIGTYAGRSNQTGYNNTFVGQGAGYNNKTGWGNTFVGFEAGKSNADGSLNVFIGYKAGYYETGSNKLLISILPQNDPLISGDFSLRQLVFLDKVGIQQASPTHMLDVGTHGAYCAGYAWVDGSSRTYKENIEGLTSTEALDAFERLEPVKFSYKDEKEETYLGFIAEDVPELVAVRDRKGLSAMDIVALLTKVVQKQLQASRERNKELEELQKTISSQQQALSAQQKELWERQERISRLERKLPSESESGKAMRPPGSPPSERCSANAQMEGKR